MASKRLSQVAIFPDTETSFAADVGATVELAVRAVRLPDLAPVAGVEVVFELISGPLGLGPLL